MKNKVINKILCVSVMIFGYVNYAAAVKEPPVIVADDIAGINYKNLIDKLSVGLPIKGMNSQIIGIDSTTLQALIRSQGIPENEAVAIADNCLDGIVFSSAGQTLKPATVTAIIVNFRNGEAAIKFDETGKKVSQLEIAQFAAGSNTSYKLVKEDILELDGFDFIRYRRSERKIDNDSIADINAVGIIGNIYVEMGFININELTENNVLKFMSLISTGFIQKSK